MNLGFWGNVPRPSEVPSRRDEGGPKPFLVQAPMLDVTDAAFRRIIAKYGKFTRPDGTVGGGPDVMFTEFVSADGLCSRGREKLLPMLWFTDAERPIVAQIFSADPGKVREASALVCKLGFDGVDINMGCPDRNVMRQGSGAALIRTPEKAREIIRAAKEGAGPLPVSVKTRVGDRSDDELERWVPELLAEGIAALTIHARTRADMSKVPARWATVRRAVEIRDRAGVHTLIIGNGDVPDVPAALARAKETGCDGVMIGRGMLGNPWLFSGLRCKPENSPERSRRSETYIPTVEEKLRVLVEHAALFEELYGADPSTDSTSSPRAGSGSHNIKNFDVMRKHFKAYVSGFPGAADIRAELMGTEDSWGVQAVVDKYIANSVQ
ncbi:MAG: tRNA-dihydrouridine synthase family protein [bacterium]|nr:tRNA-dihydrouridine synthase family protein [bacterium]